MGTFTKEEECKWCEVKQWMVEGIFEACNKKIMDMTEEEGSSDEDEEEGEGTGDMALREVSIASEGEAPIDTKTKGTYEALTIEDFRFCIYRSPDFKDTFSFSI